MVSNQEQLKHQVSISAGEHNIDYAALLAVIQVESAGKLGSVVGGKWLPIVRWEGHYFYRKLNKKKRDQAVKSGLAHPSAGGVKNPRSQVGRWRIFKRAFEIDQDAAIMSMSYGIGQVMGANWKSLGYRSAKDFFNDVTGSIAGQVRAMVSFIVVNNLVAKLNRYDWSGFARVYNGPAYRRYHYHTKMAKAYRRITGGKDNKSSSTGLLRAGSEGKQVRELQKLLIRNGYPLTVDGDFGPSTEKAIRKYQKDNGLTVDGVAGPQTFKELTVSLQSSDDDPGHVNVIDIAEVKHGGGAAISAAMLQTTGQQIKETTTELSYTVSTGWLGYLVDGLTVIATLLLVAGVMYGFYGWMKSKRTLVD